MKRVSPHFDYLRDRSVHLYTEYHMNQDETMWPLVVGVVRTLNRIVADAINNDKIDSYIYVFGLPAEDRPRMMQVYLTYTPEIEACLFEQLNKKRNINKI